jgi:hypothetical protein
MLALRLAGREVNEPLSSPYPLPIRFARSREHGTGRFRNPSQRIRCGSAENPRRRKAKSKKNISVCLQTNFNGAG